LTVIKKKEKDVSNGKLANIKREHSNSLEFLGRLEDFSQMRKCLETLQHTFMCLFMISSSSLSMRTSWSKKD